MLIKNQSASIKNLVVKMGQIYYMLSNMPRGSFSYDTKKNHRDHVNALMLRSRTQYAEPRAKVKQLEAVREPVVPTEAAKEVDKEEAHAKEAGAKENAWVNEGVKKYQDIYDPFPFPG